MTDSMKATLDRLAKTKWFTRVGQTTSDDDVVWVKSWHAALHDDGPDQWHPVRLAAVDALKSAVRAADEGRYALWDELTAEIRPKITAMAKDKVGVVIGDPRLEAIVSDLAQWDLLHFVLEAGHGDLLPKQGFYRRLGMWYLSGHFPCDWRGTYPDGELVIF